MCIPHNLPNFEHFIPKTLVALWLQTPSRLLDELGNETRPAGLVGRAQARAAIAVKILVEEDQIAEVGVGLQKFRLPVESTVPVSTQKEVDQAAGKFGRNFPKGHPAARAGGIFDFEVVAVIVMEFLKRFDDQVVDRKPDWAAPVGIAAKQAALGFGGRVNNGMRLAPRKKRIGLLFVVLGKRSNPIRGKEFGLVQQTAEDALQTFAGEDTILLQFFQNDDIFERLVLRWNFSSRAFVFEILRR